ncbi:NMT1/THI5 like domain-containing protein [Paenibacillus terrae HPL-003]|uniref:NMT1/THI5 like domain-containing protein n=1 Tax=Paenibacillus terrae (strain HPL-003) TaxID=985665 RepID=G7VQ75_PAETH|nr:ABC transporter substrate-binding protein [Paenibacillus terrae]AET61144.1 NMT1/THI5 like domain-containing protein [Paenibacillus terrae HPL-003]
MNKYRQKGFAVLLVAMLSLSTLLAACGNQQTAQNAAAETSGSTGGSGELTAVTQVTNWFAQAEHGGLYAAKEEGYYKEAGLDMTIQAGGPQVSPTQIVASGKAQFGLTTADQLLVAREEGIPLVAIATIFQKSPQGIMVHTNQNISSLADLNNHAVYVGTGSVFWDYVKSKYKLDNVKEMAYTGSLAPFVADEKIAIQGYVTSEPYEMKQQNVDVNFLLLADAGYNPYSNVLFTTEQYIQDHPDIVRAYVEASMKGWDYYKTNYDTVNDVILKENPDFTKEKLNYAAKTLIPFVYEGDAVEHGVGYMTDERWTELGRQLTEIGALKSEPDISKVFTDKFLPHS